MFHQSSAVAKTSHHEQKKARLRKTEKIPYVAHSIDVTLAAIQDVIPHVIEETRLELNTTLLVATGPVHDLVEDTNLNPGEVRATLKRIADKYDSRIDQDIESGFGIKRPDLKRKILDLIKPSLVQEIIRILRIASNNTVLNDKERKKGFIHNIAGREETRKRLSITKKDRKNWKKPLPRIQPQSATFQTFSPEYDEDKKKLTDFLLRLNTLTTSGKTKQQALIIKLEDRANNLKSIDKSDPEKQRSTLRATTSRLIAWCMLDHDIAKYPLFNALPRLIDITLEAYRTLQSNHPQIIEDRDTSCIEYLEEWEREVIRYEIPHKVKKVLEQFE